MKLALAACIFIALTVAFALAVADGLQHLVNRCQLLHIQYSAHLLCHVRAQRHWQRQRPVHPNQQRRVQQHVSNTTTPNGPRSRPARKATVVTHPQQYRSKPMAFEFEDVPAVHQVSDVFVLGGRRPERDTPPPSKRHQDDKTFLLNFLHSLRGEKNSEGGQQGGVLDGSLRHRQVDEAEAAHLRPGCRHSGPSRGGSPAWSRGCTAVGGCVQARGGCRGIFCG